MPEEKRKHERQQMIHISDKAKKKGKRKAITIGISFSKYVEDLILKDK